VSEWPGGWFGESWGAPVCEPDRHRPTPVGQACLGCVVPIAEGDQGMLIPSEEGLTAHHLDCFLEIVLGPNEVLR
jgi:hypothetical protein